MNSNLISVEWEQFSNISAWVKPKCKKHLHEVQMYFVKEMNASRGWYNRAITTLHGAEVDAVPLRQCLRWGVVQATLPSAPGSA